MLSARISDAVKSAASGTEKYLGFLGTADTSLALKAAKTAGVETAVFGGYDGAERVYVGFLPEWLSADNASFPIAPVTFSYRERDTLSHRDFLGTLMALGIERDTVGDILIEKGRAVVFVSESIAKFVLTQCSKVGRVGVTLTSGCTYPLPERGGLEEIKITVSSERVDAVVASLCKTSRNTAAAMIADGTVFIDGIEANKPTTQVREGTGLVVRGYGRFIIEAFSGTTKKGRLVINAKKYI